jgi:hypothetical protein
MEYFLQNIARDLNQRYGNELNRHCLVFPNRRAGLYFMRYLASMIQKPVWTPAVYTINELFSSYSSMQIAYPEILLFELYRTYTKVKKIPEKFDEFYFWGDMLLNDFDDVDKYLVDARLLFNNVQDLKNIDRQFGELTALQVEVIRKFWVNFNPDKPTKQKAGFTDIWSVLLDLYQEFKENIKSKGLAYEGMIFRDIAENVDGDFYSSIAWETIHFIGFNALNECEKKLMHGFRKAGKAKFYWDYDNSFIKEGTRNSAGFFMRNNIRMFGNDMPADWNYDTLLSPTAESIPRRVIETSSDVAQVKLLPHLLSQLPGLNPETAHHTAVVLADENLLIPVLTSLPSYNGDINITMGYPLRQTLVYTFLKHLMDLQRNASHSGSGVRFNHRDVLNILRHPLTESLAGEKENELIEEIIATNLLWVPANRFAESGYLSLVFSKPATTLQLSEYFRNILATIGSLNIQGNDNPEGRTIDERIRNEFIYSGLLSVNRLDSIVCQTDVTFSADTYMKILDKILKIQSVPFSGEPLSGIQIMGILETRALDFRNLIILSVNEGVLPSVSTGSSFIPFNLREAFGIPSINHQESIYAYHFYRLLERAENVTFLYNSNSDGLRTGEMSRFLNQMRYDEHLKPEFMNLNFEIRSHGPVARSITRTEDHDRRLRSRFLSPDNRRTLSPSAINTWLGCRMKFYYRYVNGLKETEEISKDIDSAMLGSILHEIMQKLYTGTGGQVTGESVIDGILRNGAGLENIIKDSISSRFSGGTDRRVEGSELIIREVLKSFVQKILKADKAVAPFSIIALESEYKFDMKVNINGIENEVTVGGIVDRIDKAEGSIRIVDYKTGSVAEKIGSVEELFTDDRKKDLDAWLQTLLYCEAYLISNPDAEIRPSVYRVRKSVISGNDKLKLKTDQRTDRRLDDYHEIREEFIENLKNTVSSIFSMDSEFVMTSDIRGKCSWCSYRGLCTR